MSALKCAAMVSLCPDGKCDRPVSMIDPKGFAYCHECGCRRRDSGQRCRKLRSHELGQLRAGLMLPSYEPITKADLAAFNLRTVSAQALGQEGGAK